MATGIRKKIFVGVGLLVFVAGLLVPARVLAVDLVVSKKEAAAREQPNKDSTVVKTLHEGDKVEGKERQGMFWSVAAEGKTAYVSVMDVKAKTAESDAVRDAAVKAGQQEEDSSVRARSAVMGVRGLDDNNVAFAGNVKPNLRMVYSMENYSVKPDQIKKLGHMVEEEVAKRMNNTQK